MKLIWHCYTFDSKISGKEPIKSILKKSSLTESEKPKNEEKFAEQQVCLVNYAFQEEDSSEKSEFRKVQIVAQVH